MTQRCPQALLWSPPNGSAFIYSGLPPDFSLFFFSAQQPESYFENSNLIKSFFPFTLKILQWLLIACWLKTELFMPVPPDFLTISFSSFTPATLALRLPCFLYLGALEQNYFKPPNKALVKVIVETTGNSFSGTWWETLRKRDVNIVFELVILYPLFRNVRERMENMDKLGTIKFELNLYWLSYQHKVEFLNIRLKRAKNSPVIFSFWLS